MSIIAVLLLLSGVLASAQSPWEGSVKADGAWNFKQSNNENLDFKLKYNKEKFFVGANLYFGHNFHPSAQTTSILDAKKEKNEFYKEEDKTINPRKFKAGGAVDFGYIFNPANILNASVGYGFNGTDENSLLKTLRYNAADLKPLNGTQLDTTFYRSHGIDSKMEYGHTFDSRPDARLDIVYAGFIKLNADGNRRITSGNFYSNPKNYVTYSSLNDFNTSLKASYDDIFHFTKSELKIKAGLDYESNQDLDAYAAETLVNGQWRDSTKYRQSYFYNSQSGEPYVNLTYSIGKFDIFVKERVQIYWHAMIDKLEDRKKPEDLVDLFDKYDFQNLLSAGTTFRINERHRLTLDYGRSIVRPDYKKLCPTLMIGKSEGEYFIGNPDLKPELTDKVNLRYTYARDIFVTNLDINYRSIRNTAEKIIDLEKSKEIADPTVKTLYTWVNTKSRGSFGIKLNLGINGQKVKAGIWAGFNYDIYKISGKPDKENFNYELGTNIDAFLSETSKLSATLAYISAKQSAYNLKGEDVLASIRFTQKIIPGLDIYAELADIVDKEIYEETWNANMNYLKVSTTAPMHRAARIGISYAF